MRPRRSSTPARADWRAASAASTLPATRPPWKSGKVLAADAALQSARAGVEDLRGRIDYDVRVAGLELKAAADRQAVAESARALAREQLRQAQDRFAAGVANNVDVVLAQEAVARAEEDWISTVYDFNLARATLGRAVGLVEDAFRQLVRGQ